MAGLTTTIERADSLADVSPDDWDRLLDDEGFYCSHGWLMGHEGEPMTEVVYVLVMRGEKLVAGLPLYRVEFELNESYDEARQQLGLETPYVVAGTHRGYRNVLAADPALSPRERTAAVRQLVEAALGMTRDWGATGIVWPFARTETIRTLAAAAPTVAMLHTAEAQIYTHGVNLDAYLAAMPKSRRKQARKDLEAFAGAGWQVTQERLEDCCEEGAELLAQVERKYGHRVTAPGLERYLRHLAATLDDRDIVFACREPDGTLAGYALMYRWGTVLYSRLVGFDYARLRAGREYFTLTFYEPIEYAATHGLSRLHLGIGALSAKVLRGAKLCPLWSAAVLDPEDGAPGLEIRRPESLSEWQRRFAHYRDAIVESDWQIPH